jgi:hypothetical protein
VLEKLIDHDEALRLLEKLWANSAIDDQVNATMVKAGKRAEPYLLPRLNSVNYSRRVSMDQHLAKIGIEEKLLIAQSVKDLNHESVGVRENAMIRLAKYKPSNASEANRNEAGRLLLAHSPANRPMNGYAVETMKAGWVTKDQSPELLKRLEEGGINAPTIVAILVKLNDPGSYEPLAQYYAKNPQVERMVRPAFLTFGAPAEDAMLKLVGNTNAEVNRTALQILADIGTSKTLATLSKETPTLLKLHPKCGIQIKVTTAKIKAREKK